MPMKAVTAWRTAVRHRWLRVVLALSGLLLAGFLALLAFSSVYRVEGYYGPVYAPDHHAVYFVQRNVVGLVWGLGLEFFTPPARVHTLRDYLTLRSVSLDRGSTETLFAWTSSPLVGRRISQYRGGLFGHVWTTIGFSETGAVQAALRMDIPTQPSSEQWSTEWSADEPRRAGVEAGAWNRGGRPSSLREANVLSGDWEVSTLRGRQALPAAVVAYNHVTRETRVLARSGEFARLYPDGPPVAMLEQQSRRADIERVQRITRTHESLVAGFLAQGLSEGTALLKASKEMQRLGYYPKTPTLTAHLVAEPSPGASSTEGADVPTFDISEMEFTVGLFHDIAEALATPGTAVDKSSGNYIIHRDYATSARLNEVLSAGVTTFRVRTRGRLYELRIDRP